MGGGLGSKFQGSENWAKIYNIELWRNFGGGVEEWFRKKCFESWIYAVPYHLEVLKRVAPVLLLRWR